jgi:prevent-host-death family protein
MIVNIHAAKTNLSKLIEKAEAGEEVVIARNGKPAVKLTPVEAAQSKPERGEGELPSWFGSLRGQIWISPDIDEVEAEIAREFEESEIFPREDDDR